MSDRGCFQVGSHVFVHATNYISGQAFVLEVRKKHLVLWMVNRGVRQKTPKNRCAKPSFLGWLWYGPDGELVVLHRWWSHHGAE